VLGCPNLPLKSTNKNNSSSFGDRIGSLFFATIGCGAQVEALEGSEPQKVMNAFGLGHEYNYFQFQGFQVHFFIEYSFFY
jgi:hypothetical protein